MNTMTVALLATLAAATAAQANTVNLADLGALQVEFKQAVVAQSYPGQPIAATVSFRQGEAFSVLSPGRVQQIDYLVEPGTTVALNQPFAVLRGPEMHHAEMNYESSRELAAGAQRRFNSNKALHARKAISESQWLEISEQYYRFMLEYEHMRHFFELVVEGDNDPDALTVAAPLAGLIEYQPAPGGVEEGDSLALFIPTGAVRLRVSLPSAVSKDVASLRAGDCELGIERVSQMTDGFFVQAWTEALPPDCRMMLGQQVLIRREDALHTVAVTLLGSESGDYIVQADETLKDAQVLVSSVSAVQGILLGLGGE
jgi:hypothetical protein